MNSEQQLKGTTGAAQRITEQLLNYWLGVRGTRNAPSEYEIDIFSLSNVWDSCFLVKYQGQDAPLEDRFAYLYLGEDLVEAYGDDLSQRDVCEALIYPSNLSLAESFQRVVDQQVPLEKDDEFTNANGLKVKYRSVLLPLLGKDAQQHDVVYILGGMRWKSYL